MVTANYLAISETVPKLTVQKIKLFLKILFWKLVVRFIENYSWMNSFSFSLWFQLYYRDGSKELWTWIFIHTSWTFSLCLKTSCVPDCWKISWVVPVFKNVGKMSTAKKCNTVSLIFENFLW